ncbi:flavodoxin family protein [Streptomyces werraensis]|uniref:flavodoxin family protein n=1 Tax=Streptomyces werraensis TaxID=68284 RepID=UPI001CE25A04
MTVASVVVVYHSGYGHTAVLADAVHSGACGAGAEAARISVDSMSDADWEVLDSADAIVFGSPTYMGTASAAFHSFAQATAKRWAAQKWAGKLAAGFTNSGAKNGDKLHTLQYMSLLAAQHGMNWVNLGLLPGWNLSTSTEDDLNRLGIFIGAGAQSNNDQGADAVHASDIATARHLGRRVAEQARVLKAGRAALAVDGL